MEPLAPCIRKNPVLSWVHVPEGDGQQLCCFFYMDDINVVVRNRLSLERILCHMERYEEVAGVKLNKEK